MTFIKEEYIEALEKQLKYDFPTLMFGNTKEKLR